MASDGHFRISCCFSGRPRNCDLAAIEWAWLESYHAADAGPSGLPILRGLTKQRLVALQVVAHPAARITALSAPLSKQLADVAAIMPDPAAILTVRPEAEVRLVPLDAATSKIFAAATKNHDVG